MATSSVSRRQIRLEHAILRSVLDGVGDRSRERLFRMNITLCVHRALTDEEVQGLPTNFHEQEAIDIAGGPVEVLWENVPQRASTRPCRNPGRLIYDTSRPDLWIPRDCGYCESCQARARIASYRPDAAEEETENLKALLTRRTLGI